MKRRRHPIPRAAGLAALPLCACLSGCGKPTSVPAAVAPAPQVAVVIVAPQDLRITTELAGRTSGRLSAEIRPQVGGIIQQRMFQEGSYVTAGQLLYRIEPSVYQAAYAVAEAGVAKAQAALHAARLTARRNAELVKIDAISRQADEASDAALKQAQAEVAAALAAQAAARINLGFTRITAPISGHIDVSTVTAGALVSANQVTALTTVQQTDPIYVNVTQSSTDLLRLRRDLAAGKLKRAGADAAAVKLILEDGSVYPLEGKLQVSGATVNPGTGAVTLRALVPNPDRLLMPGMYVKAVLGQGVAEQVLMVPQQALTRSAGGETSVLLVDASGKVEKRALVVDRVIGNAWQVSAGLKGGERVIVEGSQKVKAGDTVLAVAADAVAVAALGAPAPDGR